MRSPNAQIDALLDVEDVTTQYPVRSGGRARATTLTAVDGVSLAIGEGETLGLVGESGCGKSTLGRTILRLLEPSTGRVVFRGKDITHLGHRDLRPLRRDMQIVFQDPFASLNPRYSVKRILAEPFRIHGIRGGEEARQLSALLDLVQLPHDVADRFPHEFSGGQRQRIAIARAIALRPKLIVLDEPVSALDVSIQAQILNLLQDLQQELGLSYLFIAHDLSVVGQVSDHIAVMYLGRIVETGTRDQILMKAQHPYTAALLSAVPPHPSNNRPMPARIVLTGEPPNPLDPPSGCRFRTRCWRSDERCENEDPRLASPGISSSHVACHYPGPESSSSTSVRISPPSEPRLEP